MAPLLLFDRSGRLRIRFTGPNAVSTLDGLVSNNVAQLTAGQGCYAGALTAKGKIIADVRVFKLDDGVLVDTSPAAAAGLRDMFKKYVNPRFAKYEEASSTLAHLTVAGDTAFSTVATVAQIPVQTIHDLPPWGHVQGTFGETRVLVIRTAELGDVPAVDLLVETPHREPLYTALTASGATPGNAQQWDTLRIEAGWPAWGSDMDDNTLPQEANFDELQAIAYNKGCYIGQEPVARIHFRGHVNKTLRRLAFASDAPPPQGTQLADETGKIVGDVRSTTLSPTLGSIGLGMVRREIEDGATLHVVPGDGSLESPITVTVLGKAKGAIT